MSSTFDYLPHVSDGVDAPKCPLCPHCDKPVDVILEVCSDGEAIRAKVLRLSVPFEPAAPPSSPLKLFPILSALAADGAEIRAPNSPPDL